jgi:serine/threonine protein kinase
VDQLKLIVKTLGPPSDDDLSFINSTKARAYIRALPAVEVRAAGGAAGAEGQWRDAAGRACRRVRPRLRAAPPRAVPARRPPVPPARAARPQKVPFAQKFPEADPLAIDLLEKMLQFDPRKRIDVHEALKHPWLAQLHDEAAEPSALGACRRGRGRGRGPPAAPAPEAVRRRGRAPSLSPAAR